MVWKRLDRGNLDTALAEGWLKRGDDAEPLYVEGDLRRRDGFIISMGIVYAPLFNADGSINSLIASVRDITNFRRAQEMQNVFISTISHELKTPVALIKGHAATLRRDDVTWNDETVREYSTVIEEEADRLTELIQNLLTASRLQVQHELSLTPGDVQLDALAARAVERYRTQTTRHTFTLHFPPAFPIVPGDEARLRQVLDNLLSNAVKYSPDGGIIDIIGQDDGASVTIAVRDHGVGISTADQERIFDRFFRVDSKLSRSTQGTGLGLYLSKAIIEAHGGTLTVVSHPGHGSTFSFTLPRHGAQPRH
jgi:signal transduction histidine kinase